jgi:hypothetical protein
MKLKRGDKIFLSERGHNGFFYPTDRSISLRSDVDVNVLSWIGGGDKIAVTILESKSNHTWFKTPEAFVGPVWINRSDIIKS